MSSSPMKCTMRELKKRATKKSRTLPGRIKLVEGKSGAPLEMNSKLSVFRMPDGQQWCFDVDARGLYMDYGRNNECPSFYYGVNSGSATPSPHCVVHGKEKLKQERSNGTISASPDLVYFSNHKHHAVYGDHPMTSNKNHHNNNNNNQQHSDSSSNSSPAYMSGSQFRSKSLTRADAERKAHELELLQSSCRSRSRSRSRLQNISQCFGLSSVSRFREEESSDYDGYQEGSSSVGLREEELLNDTDSSFGKYLGDGDRNEQGGEDDDQCYASG